MKPYSVIELYSPIVDYVFTDTDNFTSIVRRHDIGFDITQLFPEDYQGKIYGWSTHLDLLLDRVVVFVLIDPKCNFILLKSLYDNFKRLNQYGFDFDANNINVNREELGRIFGGMEKNSNEFVFLEAIDQPSHL